MKKYNYILIQEDIENGLTQRELSSKWGISISTLCVASRKGKLKFYGSKESFKRRLELGLVKPQKHSAETKAKLSRKRKEYLKKNPDKVPYRLNHSSKVSWPELKFAEELIRRNIGGWYYEYRNGIYSYDFAFPDLKLDVEIDGHTHTLPKVQKIDAERDEWSRSRGWSVLRITAKDLKNNFEESMGRVLEAVKGHQDLDFRVLESFCEMKHFYEKGLSRRSRKSSKKRLKPFKDYKCKNCGTVKSSRHKLLYCSEECRAEVRSSRSNRPRKGLLSSLVESGMSLVQIGKEFGVSDNAVRKWMKSYGIAPIRTNCMHRFSLECVVCSSEFFLNKGDLRHKAKRGSKGPFCSTNCSADYLRKDSKTPKSKVRLYSEICKELNIKL